MRQGLFCFAVLFSLGITPSGAAVDLNRELRYEDHSSGDLDEWQRINLRPARNFSRRAPQIRVAIETKGPSMQGLVRIPGGLASNFDTGHGLTVVELFNPGDEARGYAEIIAIEIAFTQTIPGQVFRVFTVED